MIPYEELVEALDRYVAKNGGIPQSARVPSSAAQPSGPAAASSRAASPAAPAGYGAPSHDVDLPSGGFDEAHDPDMLPPLAGDHGGEGDATHVGASPGGAMPRPLAPVIDEDHSNEIDIHDVLDEDEV